MLLFRDCPNNVTTFFINFFGGCVMKENAYQWFLQKELRLNKIC